MKVEGETWSEKREVAAADDLPVMYTQCDQYLISATAAQFGQLKLIENYFPYWKA